MNFTQKHFSHDYKIQQITSCNDNHEFSFITFVTGHFIGYGVENKWHFKKS